MVIKPKRGQRIQVNSSKLIYELVNGIIASLEPFDRDKEHFFVIGVTRALTVRYIDWVTMGTMHATFVEPREVFRNAILQGASAVALSHNHPSGFPEPSRQDKETNDKLVEAGKIIGIKIIDHVIVADGAYYSFADEGRLNS
jgi:DNA repair protein RadC